MNNSEIKALSVDELASSVVASAKKLQSLKFAHAVSPIENPNRIRAEKKHKAKLLTELHDRSRQIVIEKIKAKELTNFNAREFLRTNRLPTPMNLDKIKKMLEQYGNS